MRKSYSLPLLLALAGCAARPPAQPPQSTIEYCTPPYPYHYDPAYAPQADFAAVLTPALLAHYPRRQLQAANAAGLLPALQKLLALEAAARPQPGPAAELAVLRQRQHIFTHINLVSATVASVAAELDCEGERADQVGGYLSQQDSRRTQRLNVLSFLSGGVSSAGTVIVGSTGGQYGFGVGGGLLTAGLGLLTLRGGGTASFAHPRNALAEVWTGKSTSGVFPPSVWYMLSNPAFSNKGERSIIENTRRRWQTYGQLGQPGTKAGQAQLALLFGEGGTYSADQLQLRANMLNELQAAVRLLNQELQGLLLVLGEEGG